MMMKSRLHIRSALLVLAVSAFAGAALAVQPDEVLPDAALEARARALSADLRCLVCQNQSIDDSNAPLARDLRLLVRERLTAGDNDKAVMDYIVERYGDFVLLKPPFKITTLLLWIAMPLFLLSGVWLARRTFRSAGDPDGATAGRPLSASEKAELEKILRNRDG
jgi:cytochrome c-type biogenesis protein CcmH